MQKAKQAATEEELALHQRLLAGDLTATADLLDRFLEPVTVALLPGRELGPDTHIFQDAASDALMNYCQDPQQYNPERLGLEAYLRMSAHGDLKNALAKEWRRGLRTIPLESEHGSLVDVLPAARNRSAEEEALERLGLELPPGMTREAAFRLVREAFPDAADRRALLLLLDGVRETAAFAQLYGLKERSMAEQREQVKRHKDRLKKRLERLRERLGVSNEVPNE